MAAAVNRRAATGAVLVAAAALAGCYKPTIADGGFKCATSGKRCPDDFTCGTDLLCHRQGSTQSDAGQCTSPPVTPSCQDPPAAGQGCNPSCQTGCACGRCNVVGNQATCTPPGPKVLGETCDPGNDNCAAGFICLQEACGNRLGRCYEHCSRADQCSGMTMCQIPILDTAGNDTGFLACDLATQDCDPVNDTGCPDPALKCYLTSASQTLCDCPNPTKQGALGDPCTIYNECAPGYVCIAGVGGLQGPHCQPACNVMTPVCPTARRCVATSGAKYGYCGI